MIDFSKYGSPLQTGATATTGIDRFAKYGTPIQQEGPAPKKRSTLGKVAEFLAPAITHTVEKAFNPNQDVTARDIIGSGLEAASYLLPVGAAAKGVSLAARGLGLATRPIAKGVATSLGKRTLEYAAGGALSGGLFGAGGAVQEGEGAGGIASRAATTAAFGGVTGAVLPLAGRAISKTYGGIKNIAGRSAIKQAEQTAILKTGAPDARVAAKVLTESGQMANDPIAKEVIRQGIPEADVALIKVSSAADKAKMHKMLTIRESQLVNKRVTDRATDVVGDTFIEKVAKPIQDLNKKAGAQLDVVAQRLAGAKVDASPALTQLGEEFTKAGIKTRVNGTLNFAGSDFEGLRSIQSSIQNVWSRALRVAKTGDALQAHRLKRYIDNIVEYGSEGEGLRGNAERILKGFRRAVDTVLDQKFPAYNKANTVFADTIGELNKLGVVLGKRFRLGDTFADAQAGMGIRRVMSNTQSRAEVLKLIDGMQKVAAKYGIKIDEDVINQASFADVLEKMLGSEAPTSLLGQFEKGFESFGSSGGYNGVQQVGSAASEFARGNMIRGTIKGAGTVIDVLKGVNQTNRIKALRALLGDVEKGLPGVGVPKPTVFGKPPKARTPSQIGATPEQIAIHEMENGATRAEARSEVFKHYPELSPVRKPPKGPGAVATPKTTQIPKSITHPEIGDIEMFAGQKSSLGSKGYGMEKIKTEHPEIISRLHELQNAKIVERLPQRLILETTGKKPIRAVVDLQFGDKPKIWLMNAYEKNVPRR